MINRRKFVQMLSGAVCGLGIGKHILAAAATDCPWHIESDGTPNGTKVFFNGQPKELVTDIYAQSTSEPGVWLLDLSFLEIKRGKPKLELDAITGNVTLQVVTGDRATITLHGHPLRFMHDRAVFQAVARNGLVTLQYTNGVVAEQKENHV